MIICGNDNELSVDHSMYFNVPLVLSISMKSRIANLSKAWLICSSVGLKVLI
jgi:hypothetical protein